MQIPLEITFHHIDKTDWAEDAIRDHVDKLEEIYDRIIACRVRVDQRVDPQTSIPPVVRIELSLPGTPDIVVAHEPDRLQRKFQAPDLRNAINEAFRIAARQLAGLKAKRNDHSGIVRAADGAAEARGQVAELPPGEDFGFVLTHDGGLLYFHRNSLLVGDFDALRRGDELSYVETVGDTGPVATKVRKKPNGRADH